MGVVDHGSGILVEELALEGSVDEDGELARGGGVALADAIGEAAIEGAERGLSAAQVHRGEPEQGGRAIGGGLGAGAEQAPPGDPVLGRQGLPRNDVAHDLEPGDTGDVTDDEVELTRPVQIGALQLIPRVRLLLAGRRLTDAGWSGSLRV